LFPDNSESVPGTCQEVPGIKRHVPGILTRKQVPTNAPVIVRIELSAPAREGSGAESHRQSVRFTLNGGAATGTFALAYDRAATRV
jgi:hypothetical protein